MSSNPISFDTFDPHSRIPSADREARHSAVLWQGTKALAVAAPASLAGSLLAQKYLRPYQRLSLPFKTFIGLMIPTAVFFTVTDRAAIRADLDYAMKFSVTKKEDLASSLPDAQHTLTDMLHNHRYQIIGWGWIGTLAGTLAYNWKRRDIGRDLKIINARMAAQTFALAGIMALAGLASTTKPKDIDPHYTRIVNGG
ncbi:hypothetical protein DFS34DRAFT_413553 [Phlyctochytrium arcticum]|nr:hypothetical protein DFS34DRAFT_413553 [Phlyctochytrium arcticum]